MCKILSSESVDHAINFHTFLFHCYECFDVKTEQCVCLEAPLTLCPCKSCWLGLVRAGP